MKKQRLRENEDLRPSKKAIYQVLMKKLESHGINNSDLCTVDSEAMDTFDPREPEAGQKPYKVDELVKLFLAELDLDFYYEGDMEDYDFNTPEDFADTLIDFVGVDPENEDFFLMNDPDDEIIGVKLLTKPSQNEVKQLQKIAGIIK